MFRLPLFRNSKPITRPNRPFEVRITTDKRDNKLVGSFLTFDDAFNTIEQWLIEAGFTAEIIKSDVASFAIIVPNTDEGGAYIEVFRTHRFTPDF